VIQTEVLSFHQLFRTPCAAPKPRLRVLALAADIDMGGNTPIDFLLEDSDIELLTLYVVKGIGLLSEFDRVSRKTRTWILEGSAEPKQKVSGE